MIFTMRLVFQAKSYISRREVELNILVTPTLIRGPAASPAVAEKRDPGSRPG